MDSTNSPPLNPLVARIGAFPYAAFQAVVQLRRSSGQPLYDFGVGDPKEATPEFIRMAYKNAVPEVSQYPTVKGDPDLRATIASYVKRRFKVELNPGEQILPTLGSKEAVYHTPFLVAGADPGRDLVIVGTPGYFVALKGAVMAGLTPYEVALTEENGYLLDLRNIPVDILKRTCLVWLNYPHNPTGTSCDLKFLQAQVEVARTHGILLCSDETYADIYESTPPPSVLQVCTKGVLAYHSCSKRSGMTGYRSGFVAGDTGLIQAFAMFRNTIGNAPSITMQAAATAAWGDTQHAVSRRECFTAKRELMRQFLVKANYTVNNSRDTFYLWVKAPKGETAMAHAEQLLHQGIVVSPGDFYGEANSKWFRIALAPDISTQVEAMEVWKTALREGLV